MTRQTEFCQGCPLSIPNKILSSVRVTQIILHMPVCFCSGVSVASGQDVVSLMWFSFYNNSIKKVNWNTWLLNSLKKNSIAAAYQRVLGLRKSCCHYPYVPSALAKRASNQAIFFHQVSIGFKWMVSKCPPEIVKQVRAFTSPISLYRKTIDFQKIQRVDYLIFLAKWLSSLDVLYERRLIILYINCHLTLGVGARSLVAVLRIGWPCVLVWLGQSWIS